MKKMRLKYFPDYKEILTPKQRNTPELLVHNFYLLSIRNHFSRWNQMK